MKRIFKGGKNIGMFINRELQLFKLVGKNIGGNIRGDGEDFIDARITLKKLIKIDIIINKIRR
jgi:hypothetical protein